MRVCTVFLFLPLVFSSLDLLQKRNNCDGTLAPEKRNRFVVFEKRKGKISPRSGEQAVHAGTFFKLDWIKRVGYTSPGYNLPAARQNTNAAFVVGSEVEEDE